jgi:HK97 family phage major capsid protein
MNLKGKKERRAEIIESLDNILKLADTEKRDLSEKENQDYVKLEKELETVTEEVARLERQEERKKALAKESADKNEDVEVRGEDKGKDVKVTDKHKATEEYRNAKMFSMIQGSVQGDQERVTEAKRSLAEGGHYDDVLQGERRNFSTLTDPKGSVFLPTSVSNTIMNIAQEYGVIPRLTMNIGNIIGSSEVKIPQIMGRPTFTAVNQQSAISGSGFNLGGISLKPLKWGAIIDWTNEADEAIGAKLMPIIMQQVAEGQAYIMDNTFFNGDGTSTYNNIKGLEGLTGTQNYVRTATATTTHTSFATLTADDLLKPQENVAPGARGGSVYVMHPNMIFTLRKLKDTQGKYIYGDPSQLAPTGTLWGYPIETSEAFAYTDGVTKTVMAFFNPKYVAFATGRSLTATRLGEATITNENGTSVNLATTDAQAIRLTFLFDMKVSSITRTTASTAQGAFSVLRTAAS